MKQAIFSAKFGHRIKDAVGAVEVGVKSANRANAPTAIMEREDHTVKLTDEKTLTIGSVTIVRYKAEIVEYNKDEGKYKKVTNLEDDAAVFDGELLEEEWIYESNNVSGQKDRIVTIRQEFYEDENEGFIPRWVFDAGGSQSFFWGKVTAFSGGTASCDLYKLSDLSQVSENSVNVRLGSDAVNMDVAINDQFMVLKAGENYYAAGFGLVG